MKMEHLFKKSLLAAGAAALLAACGTPTPEETAPEASMASQQDGLLASCDPVELAEVAEHACVHSDFGPFEPVTAAALGAPVFVDVSAPHTAYVITLPADPVQGWAGRVAYIPEESGEFAFLVSRYRGLRIYDAATGAEVARECRYSVPTNVCGSLKKGIVADLEAGVEYHLEFKAIAERNATFTLLVEEAGHEHTEG
jgi:hypothetical protein